MKLTVLKLGETSLIIQVLIFSFLITFSGVRLVFTELGILGSILPSGINVLAVTATATKSTLDIVVERLAMINPLQLGVHPTVNTHFSVRPSLHIKEFSQMIAF